MYVQMQLVQESFYDIKWIEKASPRIKTGILLTIQTSQNRLNFSAGGIMNIDMESFANVRTKNF